MSEYNDAHMLSKTLERIAAQAMHLKEKIDAGLEIPSWAEYKVYSAYDGIGKALGTSYPGEYEDDDDEKMAAAFTPALNRHPALKGGQSRLPDKVQAGIIKEKLRMRKHAADWSQYEEDDVRSAGRIAENRFKENSEELAENIYAGLLKDPTHPKNAPSMVPIGAIGGGVIGAGLGYPLSFIPKMKYAPAVTGSAGALLGGITGHAMTSDMRGAHGDQVYQEALETQRRRLENPELMRQLSRDMAEDYLRPIDKKASAPYFYSDNGRLYHDIGNGVMFSLPEGESAEEYKKMVEKEHGFVGSTAPTSKDDPLSFRMGKAVSRRMDARNPDRPRYRSLKDFILRRPDPNYRPGAEVRPLKKEASVTATKTDPQKWEAAKAEARAKMGGKHSARAMQLATQIYKKKGGGYSGPKPTSSTNSLKKWTKQDWNWTGGDKPGQGGRGVYLPKQRADRLRETEGGKDQLAAAARKKREATRKGEQYSSHGLAANTSLRKK